MIILSKIYKRRQSGCYGRPNLEIEICSAQKSLMFKNHITETAVAKHLWVHGLLAAFKPKYINLQFKDKLGVKYYNRLIFLKT